MDTEIWITIGAIFVLLLLSAFFSGSETALTAVSRPHMHHLLKTGDKRAGIIAKLHARMERLIGTILLVNNLVNILASALATSLLIGVFGDTGVAYATLVMTLLVLIFAEVLPKTYAINNADRTALSVAPVVRLLVLVLSPLSDAVQVVVRATLRLFSVSTESNLGAISDDELRGAIDLHAETGSTDDQERAMLRSILDLDHVEVGEIMVHRKDIFTVDAGLSPTAILEQVIASPYTRIPMWRKKPDNIISILHAKTLLSAVKLQAPAVEKLDISSLAAKPWFIPESTTLLQQLHAFRKKREHFALVVDEYGVLMGIVTLEDILEEIVGDISDEFDIAVPGVHLQTDDTFIIKGDVTIRDLNRQFDWSLPDDQAATLAGLVLHESRRIPDVGQVFNFYDFRFEILRRKRNQITSLRLSPPKHPPSGPES
ncbi:MAG: HlyC/CorC family transporter [Alphaproteobacteria bacterium]|nr:HlyC/CorC family transporter [Alphaproteobacteria bacterium]MDP7044793.1 HlyC/CorC family transporter [Alphaproteobacteria bacterium]